MPFIGFLRIYRWTDAFHECRHLRLLLKHEVIVPSDTIDVQSDCHQGTETDVTGYAPNIRCLNFLDITLPSSLGSGQRMEVPRGILLQFTFPLPLEPGSKNKFFPKVRNTLNSFYHIASSSINQFVQLSADCLLGDLTTLEQCLQLSTRYSNRVFYWLSSPQNIIFIAISLRIW